MVSPKPGGTYSRAKRSPLRAPRDHAERSSDTSAVAIMACLLIWLVPMMMVMTRAAHCGPPGAEFIRDRRSKMVIDAEEHGAELSVATPT